MQTIWISHLSRKILDRMSSGPRRGKIVSVFGRSMNAEMEGGFLLHIGSDELPLTPRSVLVGEKDFYHFLLPRCLLDETVLMAPGSIYMREVQLNLSPSTTRTFEPRVCLSDDFPSHLEISRNLIRALRWVQEPREGSRDGGSFPFRGYFLSHIPFIRRLPDIKGERQCSFEEENGLPFQWRKILWERASAFLLAVSREDWAESRECTRNLVGLGPGLTPSGDDFLAGFISVGIILGQIWPGIRACARQIAAMVKEEGAGRTTSVSVSILEDAAGGEVGQPMIRFLLAVLQEGRAEEIPSAAEEICKIGASSGEDLLNGMAAGILFYQSRAMLRGANHEPGGELSASLRQSPQLHH